jgi:hypothetical protein
MKLRLRTAPVWARPGASPAESREGMGMCADGIAQISFPDTNSLSPFSGSSQWLLSLLPRSESMPVFPDRSDALGNVAATVRAPRRSSSRPLSLYIADTFDPSSCSEVIGRAAPLVSGFASERGQTDDSPPVTGPCADRCMVSPRVSRRLVQPEPSLPEPSPAGGPIFAASVLLVVKLAWIPIPGAAFMPAVSADGLPMPGCHGLEEAQLWAWHPASGMRTTLFNSGSKAAQL